MPSVISFVSFKTTFVLDGNTGGTFLFEDTTDYTGASIPLSGVVGVFKIITPSLVVIYNNTDFSRPDIDVGVSTFNSTTIALPIAPSTGLPETGNYIITYEAQIDDGVNPIYYRSQENKIMNSYARPAASATTDVNCVDPSLTVTDTTAYTVQSVTPTISRDIEVTYPVDPNTNQQIHPPFVSTISPATTSVVGNGDNLLVMNNDVVYVFVSGTNGFSVTDTLRYQRGFTVDCTTVCSLVCCVRSLEQRVLAAQYTNPTEYQSLRQDFVFCMSFIGFIRQQIDCGRTDLIDGAVQAVKNIAKCSDDCGCGTTPTLVVGLGPGVATNIVVSAPLEVTSETIGSVTTFYLNLTDAFLTQFASLHNTTVAVNTSGLSNVLTVQPDGTYAYLITNTAIPIYANLLAFQADIQYTLVPAVTVTANSVLVQGANFQAPTIVSVGFGTDPNWAVKNNRFRVSGFQVAASSTYKVNLDAAIVSFQPPLSLTPLTAANMYKSSTVLYAEIVDQSTTTGTFDFVLRKRDGSPIVNQDLAVGHFIVNITITQ